MSIHTPHAALTLVVGFVLAFGDRALAQKQWDVEVTRADSSQPVIVGQDVMVCIKVINRTGKIQKQPKVLEGRLNGFLRLTVTRPSGTKMGSCAGRYNLPKESDYHDMAPDGKDEATFALSSFGYSAEMFSVGDNVIDVAYDPVRGTTIGGKVAFKVFEVRKDQIAESRDVQVQCGIAQAPRTETAYVQTLRVDGKEYLYYRRLIEGKPVLAVGLGELAAGSKIEASAEGKIVTITCRLSKGGGSEFKLNGVDGTIEKTKKLE